MAPQQPSPDVATAEALTHLAPFVPADQPGLPSNQLGLVEIQVKNIALGHRRGSTYRAGQPVMAQTGLFLDATARIEIWGATPDDVETSISTVQSNLLSAAPTLRALGFLNFFTDEISSAAHEASIPAWRKSGDFKFRYEFLAEDSDDAESFVVRIPVSSSVDADATGGPETHTILDGMRRWDNEGAPTLVIRGAGGHGVRLIGVAAFDFRPGGFTGVGVTLTRTIAGAVAAPTVYPTLANFLAAVSDPTAPDRNAQVSFSDLPTFLTALPDDGGPIPLGLFQPRRLNFDAPIVLATPCDLFTVAYDQPAFSAQAIVYLRVHTIPFNSG